MAPVTTGSVSVIVLPEHIVVGGVIAVAASGTVLGVTVNVPAGPVPQAFVAVAIMVPVPAPTVAVTLPVVLDPAQPVPETVQVKEVPLVPVAAKPAVDVPTQAGDVAVMVGAVGTLMAATVKV